MRLQLLILSFLLSGFQSFGQLPSIRNNYDKEDTTHNPLLNTFVVNTDFTITHTYVCYWWANLVYYRVLTYSDGSWKASKFLNYKPKKRKKSIQAYKIKTFTPYFVKAKENIPDSVVKILLDSLNLQGFWNLNKDSLTDERNGEITDLATDRFDIFQKANRRSISAYALNYYIDKYPDRKSLNQFKFCLMIFNRWWKKYCF